MEIKKRRKWKDIIGDILGYGRCGCGKSFWYANLTSPHIQRNGLLINSKIKCDECSTNVAAEKEAEAQNFMKAHNIDCL